MNNKLMNYIKLMSITSFTEKSKKKKLEFVRFYVGSGYTIPGSASADPDPHQNEADPKHREKYMCCLEGSRSNATEILGGAWNINRLEA